MNFKLFALVVAMASPCLLAQVAPARLEEAKRLSQGWKRYVGGRQLTFPELTPKDQLEFLIGTARDNRFAPNRDAALVLLTQWPYEQGLAKVILGNPLGELALKSLGYQRPAVLAGDVQPTRPWVHGVGLHLDGANWRLQMIPTPAFLPVMTAGEGLPKPLETAPVPSALIRLKQLRPGLQRLADVVGGSEDNLIRTAAAGGRAGFLLRHVQSWMTKAEPALGPLADRPAWILHYGLTRPERVGMENRRDIATPQGTLVFIPGPLPKRTELALTLMRLNPFSGARARKGQLADGTPVDQVRGSGGVLHLETTPEGTWICDREATLVARHQGAWPTLGRSPGWGRVALAGAGQASASLWLIPRQAVGADFENSLATLPKSLDGAFPAATNDLLKAAPRGSALSGALGSGPTARALQAFFRVDMRFEPPVPSDPTLGGQAIDLSPEQKKSLARAKADGEARVRAQDALRRQLDRLARMLDGQGAAFHWNGWTAAPPLSEAEKAALVEFRKQGYWTNARKEKMRQAPGFGGYGEPGLTPSFALALPLKGGRSTDADALLAQLFPAAFKGALQSRPIGSVTLRRMRTVQAFAPSYAIQGNVLILASDDVAASATLAGLQGQAPTLADLPPMGWGQLEWDGPRLAAESEKLLQAYLGAESGKPRRWWEDSSAPQSGDEVAEEVSSTFGPLLDLLRRQGRLRMEMTLGAAGLELRPK